MRTPVPFGGRGAELDRLNGWLAEESPRNLLLTAPAGRGKTALLVRWISQLGDAWPIAFVPISIRYETNRAAVFYQALAARLASILGETLPPTPSDPATFYKEKVIEYIDRFDEPNRRCLVVIDGLDEATGWQVDTTVLPSEPPQGLRIVASARQLAGDHGAQDWLRRLGWVSPLRSLATTLEVPPLSREGISDVLSELGFPLADFAKNVDILGELFRLTEEGDPLLLQLYVADLWKRGEAAARMRPEDLAKLEPGFGAYFRDWFEQQRRVWHDTGLDFDKEKLNGLLALLSCALGPIKLDALSQVFQRVVGTKCFLSRETLEPIGRFVIGDGVESGFALGHPKLAEFIQNDYFGSSQIIDDTRKAIAEWGRAVVHDLESNALSPPNTPEYCLLYYVQHLEEIQRHIPPVYYRELVEDGWRSAWLSHEEGLRGFAGDLEVVWTRLRKAAETDPQTLKQAKIGLGGLIRCALCLSSIRSIGATVPPNFMAELVRQGILSVRQALHLLRLKSEDDQVAALQALAPHLKTDLDEAISGARQIRDSGHRAIGLAAVANYALEPRRSQLLHEALGLAEQSDEIGRWARTRQVRKYMSPLGEREFASEMPAAVVTSREAPSLESRSLEDSGPLPQETAMKALAEVLSSPPDWERSRNLRTLAPNLPENVLSKALDVVLQWDGYHGGEGLEILLPSLSPELLKRALEAVLQWDGYDGLRGLEILLPSLSPELLKRALEAVLQKVAYDRRETRKDYYDSLKTTRDEVHRREILKVLLPYLPPESPNGLLETVLQWNPSSDRPETLKVLLPYLTPDSFSKLLDAILRWDSWERQLTLSALAPLLPPNGLRQAVAAFSDNLRDLDSLLPYLPDAERAAVVTATYETSFRINDDMPFAATLVAIASWLPETEADEAIVIARAVAREISDKAERAWALLFISCSPRISEAQSAELLVESFYYARQVFNPETRLFLECAILLAPQVTDQQIEEVVVSVPAAFDGLRRTDRLGLMYLLLLGPKLSQETWRELLHRFKAELEKTPEEHDCVFFLPLSLLPRITQSEARTFLRKGIAMLSDEAGDEDRALALTLAALSPNITITEAEECAAELRREPTEIGFLFDLLRMSHLSDLKMLQGLKSILDKSIKHTRRELLGALSVLEGRWLDLLGISPVIFRGEPSRSYLVSVGGTDALLETFSSIRDIRRWWP